MRKLPEVGEPLYELCSIAFVENDVREVAFQNRRTRVACVEEHELGFAQMCRSQCGAKTIRLFLISMFDYLCEKEPSVP